MVPLCLHRRVRTQSSRENKGGRHGESPIPPVRKLSSLPPNEPKDSGNTPGQNEPDQ